MITFLIIWAVCIVLGIVVIVMWRKDVCGDAAAVLGVILTIIEVFMIMVNIVSTWCVVENNLPTTIHSVTVEYEETYNTLTTLLKNKDKDIVVLSEQVIKYNTAVKNYDAHMSNPWVNWYYAPVEHEFETINLEDYLN